MTHPDLRAAGCEGKHLFADSRIARQVATQMSRRRDRVTTSYRCEHCGFWHVGQSKNMKKPPFKK